MTGTPETWPTVGVVVPTHQRPALLRRTLMAILAQDVPIGLDVVVVFDRSTPDLTLEQLSTGNRRVRVMTNQRTPGLAGNRNTGILALETDWVAFCDDDDTWAPGKLRAQLERARRHPEAVLVTTSITVAYEDSPEVARLAGQEEIRHADLLRSRMAMLHSSTVLLRRSALLGPLGWWTSRSPAVRTRTGTCSCVPRLSRRSSTSTSRWYGCRGDVPRTSPGSGRPWGTPWSTCSSVTPGSPTTTGALLACTASWPSATRRWAGGARPSGGRTVP